jgi:hypothetical protein
MAPGLPVVPALALLVALLPAWLAPSPRDGADEVADDAADDRVHSTTAGPEPARVEETV